MSSYIVCSPLLVTCLTLRMLAVIFVCVLADAWLLVTGFFMSAYLCAIVCICFALLYLVIQPISQAAFAHVLVDTLCQCSISLHAVGSACQVLSVWYL